MCGSTITMKHEVAADEEFRKRKARKSRCHFVAHVFISTHVRLTNNMAYHNNENNMPIATGVYPPLFAIICGHHLLFPCPYLIPPSISFSTFPDFPFNHSPFVSKHTLLLYSLYFLPCAVATLFTENPFSNPIWGQVWAFQQVKICLQAPHFCSHRLSYTVCVAKTLCSLDGPENQVPLQKFRNFARHITDTIKGVARIFSGGALFSQKSWRPF